MKIRLAAALSAVIVLVGIVGAPVLPVMIGTALTYGWLVGWLVWMGRRHQVRAPMSVPRDP